MFKTPIRAKFVSRLERINDQLCFAAFGRHELGALFAPHVAASPKAYSTDIFPANPHARRIYRMMKDMPEFAAVSEEIELQMVVISGVEHALAYIAEIEAFRRRVILSPADAIKCDAPEDQIFDKMSGWTGSAPVRGDYRTLGYLRLLRNHYAHVNDDPSPAFAAYLAQHSHHLQSFWANGVTQLGTFQFRTLVDAPLTASDAFAIMNLLRVVIEHIDTGFAGTLTLEAVLPEVTARLFATCAGHDRTPERLSPKVRAAIEHDYGPRFGVADIRSRVDAYFAAVKHR